LKRIYFYSTKQTNKQPCIRKHHPVTPPPPPSNAYIIVLQGFNLIYTNQTIGVLFLLLQSIPAAGSIIGSSKTIKHNQLKIHQNLIPLILTKNQNHEHKN